MLEEELLFYKKMRKPSLSLSPASKFKKGDTVQWTEDPRYIGRVLSPGSKIKVRWVDGSDNYLFESELRLFTDLGAGGVQQVYGEYAFAPGDRVTTNFKNYKKVTFTVTENYPSGMVGLTYSKHQVSLPGNQLNLVKKAAPKKEELCLVP